MVKNKIAPPFKEAEFDIIFGEGISVTGDVLDLAAGANIVNKSGAWYAYEGNKIGQGRENSKQYLKDNPEIFAEISAKVREHYGLQNSDEDTKKDTDKKKAETGSKKSAEVSASAKAEAADKKEKA